MFIRKTFFLLYLGVSYACLNVPVETQYTKKKKNPKINYFVSKTSAHALIWVFSFQP